VAEMFGALEIILIVAILGGLLLLQSRARVGSVSLYITVVVLLLLLILATRIIRSLVGALIVLALLCAILFFKVIRS